VREKAVIGLLLLAEPWQHRGLGRAFAALIEQAIGAWPEIDRLRLGVAVSNTAALIFWRKLGYRETGEVKPPQPGMVADVHVFEKPLRRGPTA
jgi:ribosomal protein S18 acetylase RimI-like enzyme